MVPTSAKRERWRAATCGAAKRPSTSPAYDARLRTLGEPFDLAFFVTPSVDYFDPYAFLNLYFDSRFIGRANVSNLRSPTFDRRLRAASRLRGSERLRAYRRLDGDLMRQSAPVAPL